MNFTSLLNTEEYAFLHINPRLGSRIMLLGVSGSYGYGTNREGSDIDFRGVALNLPSDLIGLTAFEQYEDSATDTVIYSFNKLVSLLLNCNPNTIEILGLRPWQCHLARRPWCLTPLKCCLHSHERNQIVKYCVHKDITSWCIPRIGDVIMSGAEKVHLFHLPMLRVGRYNPTPEYLIMKRTVDIVVAGTALFLFAPIMIVLAIVIRMDGGTAFYRQKRLTKDGKIFEILKFRSMIMDAEKDGVARLFSGDSDPRITKVGQFIRTYRLDELPQLFNILAGDMSIVGPRPERPEIAMEYKKVLPEFDLRLQCKCGLTGFAQVYGKYNTTPYDKLLMDLMYIAQPSMVEDLKICFATVKILFLKDSTEGVEEGQFTSVKRMFTSIENDMVVKGQKQL